MRKTVTFLSYYVSLVENHIHLVSKYLFETILLKTSHSKQRISLVNFQSHHCQTLSNETAHQIG